MLTLRDPIYAGYRHPAELICYAVALDQGFPANGHVQIVKGEPVVQRLHAREAEGAGSMERLLKEHMAPVGILDALADTEHWLE